MQKYKLLLWLFLAGTFTSIKAQNPSVNIKDFVLLEGKWKGQLVYRDYSSNKDQTIPCNISVDFPGENKFTLNLYYTEEPDHNAAEIYEIKANGTLINDRKVIERIELPDGSLRVVTEDKGMDGNDPKPAIFHHEIIISKIKLIITKLVRYEGEEKFFQRNQYVFTR